MTTGAMLLVTSDGNFFMEYKQEPSPESLRIAGRLASEGESVRSRWLALLWVEDWRPGFRAY